MQVDVATVRRHPDQLTILKTWPQMATSSTEDLDEVWIGWVFFFFLFGCARNIQKFPGQIESEPRQ